MDADDGHELQHREDEADRDAAPRRRPEHEEVEDHHVPAGGEAAEPEVGRLHARVGEIDGGARHDHRAERERRVGRHEIGAPEGDDGHDHVGEIVDDEVEQRAVDEGSALRYPQRAGEGAVDPVDDERNAEPAESAREIPLHDGGERREPRRRAECREHVHADGRDRREVEGHGGRGRLRRLARLRSRPRLRLGVFVRVGRRLGFRSRGHRVSGFDARIAGRRGSGTGRRLRLVWTGRERGRKARGGRVGAAARTGAACFYSSSACAASRARW